jgi:uncharacterized lipoprotein YbaY
MWTLTWLNGAPLIQGNSITLNFDHEGGVSGSSGCNTYGGNYEVSINSITFSDIYSTERACAQDGVMEQESAYLFILTNAISYALNSDQMLIMDNFGNQLTFSAVATASQLETISAMPAVSVEVSYRQRIALPPQAYVLVQLISTGASDADSVVLYATTIPTNGGQVPFTIDLPYDPAVVGAMGTLAIHAEIRAEGEVLFVSTPDAAQFADGQLPEQVALQLNSPQ